MGIISISKILLMECKQAKCWVFKNLFKAPQAALWLQSYCRTELCDLWFIRLVYINGKIGIKTDVLGMIKIIHLINAYWIFTLS